MYNALIRNDVHYNHPSGGVIGRVLLTDLSQVPSSWLIRFRSSELKRSTDIEQLMCGPDEPIQLYKPTRDLKTFIFIASLTGKFEIKVSLVDTVADVKMQIQFLKGIPPDEQRLIFAGTQLENWPRLKDIGITNGSTITFVMRLRGGGGPGLSTVDLEGKQLAGRGVPAIYPWNGYTIGLNLFGVCPNQDCVSNSIKNGSKKITVQAKYGLVLMTRESNKFQCPACKISIKKENQQNDLGTQGIQQTQKQVEMFCPTNFVVSYARSLFRFKKSGWDQPVKSVLMESLGLDDEYKTFDAGNGNSDYDFIEIKTVGINSSPYHCVKCDQTCGNNRGIWVYCPGKETLLKCGHAYHRDCFDGIEECIVCKAERFDSIQDFLRKEKCLRKRKTTDRKEVKTTKRGRCDAKGKSEAADIQILEYSYQRHLWEIRCKKGLQDPAAHCS